MLRLLIRCAQGSCDAVTGDRLRDPGSLEQPHPAQAWRGALAAMAFRALTPAPPNLAATQGLVLLLFVGLGWASVQGVGSMRAGSGSA